MKVVSLEAVFKKATQRHESLSLLQSQWSFDKELISKALQNIASIFPHYSRHDASHSRQIVVNIERMLGERVRYLTATDMWLILEAAYSHDIGMVITSKQIEDLDSPGFSQFVDDLANDSSSEFHEFAKSWQEHMLKLPTGSAAHDLFEQYKRLLAEWYRKKHPENAEKIIRDPAEEIGLSSPRNELLPRRLFNVLAMICNSHGQTFEQVMELPFSEAGLGTEDCHPRYVACLLRMGDLLDIDDNRFCPVMMKMSGVSLPSISHAHLEKHQGIKHFRLDSERIKIQVTCPSPESYEIAHDWFKWLEQEYHSQSQHWPKIVPSKKLGRLPTLAPPQVWLKPPYVTLNEGRKPAFEVDKEATLKLLRSTGLYSSRFDSIREILQNAVDSTLLAIWRDHAAQIEKLNPVSPELAEIYKSNQISVSFERRDPRGRRVTLIVKDKGVGISGHDLKKLIRVGGSSKNSEKMRAIRKMPPWFRPAGNFGIGLQSIYLLSREFRIYTKSRITHEAFRLDFKDDGGSALTIVELDAGEVEYGAVVEVDVVVGELPDSISIPFGGQGDYLRKHLGSYDFTKAESNLSDYELALIFEALHKFNTRSPIKLSGFNSGMSNTSKTAFFCKETNILLSEIKIVDSEHSEMQAYFRGQHFKGLDVGLPFISGIVDFYGEAAMGFLSYNRENIVHEAKRPAGQLVRKAIVNYIVDRFDDMEADRKPYAAVVHAQAAGRWRNGTRFDESILKFPIILQGMGGVELGEVVDLLKQGLIKFLGSSPWGWHDKPFTEKGFFEITRYPAVAHSAIKVFATEEGLFWRQKNHESIEMSEWLFEDDFPVADDIARKLFGGESEGVKVGRRVLFPCWGKYRALAVKSDIPWAWRHEHTTYQNDYLVLPYAFSWDAPAVVDCDGEMLSWVLSNLKNEALNFEEVSGLYKDLLSDLKPYEKNGSSQDV